MFNKIPILRGVNYMTYSDRATELQDDIRHDLNHSDEISLDSVKEWNRIICDVMYGSKTWDDEYK